MKKLPHHDILPWDNMTPAKALSIMEFKIMDMKDMMLTMQQALLDLEELAAEVKKANLGVKSYKTTID